MLRTHHTEARRRRSAPGHTCSACRGSSPGAKPPRPQHKRPWSRNHLGMGRARLGGGERSRGRQTEARKTIPHGQKEERKEAVHLPHTAVAETAGARRNRAATPTAMRSRQSTRGIRVMVCHAGERGAQPDWARLVRPNPLGLVCGPRLSVIFFK
jgi:hypothetical protein